MTGGRLALAALLAFASAACGGCGGGEDEPRRVDLARAEIAGAALEGELAPGVRAVREGEDRWLVASIPRAAWRAEPGEAGATAQFSAPLPAYHVGAPRAGGAAYRLRALSGEVGAGPARELAFERDVARLSERPGTFTAERQRARLALAPGEQPPESAELWACVAFERETAGGRRVVGRRLSGAGVWVPSGRPRALMLRIPADSRLRFGTAIEPLLGAKEARLAPRTFRVRLDGALVFERTLEVDVLGEALEWHALDLPRGGVQRARIELEVDGPPALTSFLAPRVGPRELGGYGARGEAGDPRPDLVVFLADTFRADNLAAYGSTLGLTPEIDRFAAESRTFARAWSTSTHTLPTHSSMFSGVYPHQNGQVDYDNPLPAAVETLAERLSAAGYRCGLVSDGVMVSSSHGLDQGFESFDERKEADTLARARAFLDADDGRPIFLFVQSYHVHAPYVVGEETRARLGGALDLASSFDELLETPAMRAIEEHWPERELPPEDEATRETARRLFDLYRAKVTELDAMFGAFRGELERRGVLPRGTLVFTSDHGEAFFEHGRPFHAGRVFEEELRVPLIVHGPRFERGREERPVSLVDFAPTLFALAGLDAPAHWRGRSWLEPDAARIVYAFQSRDGDSPTLAVIDGDRKVIGYELREAVRAGRLHAAFDLAADPAELVDVRGRESWPEELFARHRAALEEMLTPLVEAEELDLLPDKRDELAGMGYTGGGDDEDEDENEKKAAEERAAGGGPDGR